MKVGPEVLVAVFDKKTLCARRLELAKLINAANSAKTD
jgi:hypothetical protein